MLCDSKMLDIITMWPSYIVIMSNVLAAAAAAVVVVAIFPDYRLGSAIIKVSHTKYCVLCNCAFKVTM